MKTQQPLPPSITYLLTLVLIGDAWESHDWQYLNWWLTALRGEQPKPQMIEVNR
jgi:hypothetical protein